MQHDVKPGVMPSSFFPKYEGKLAKEEPAPKVSKVAQAIEYMKAHGGTASIDEIRDVLNIVPPNHPAAWLGSALRSGRIIKTDTGFALGQAPVGVKESEPVSNDAFNKALEEGEAKWLATSMPAEYLGAVADSPAPADNIDATLAERGKRYGVFIEHAHVTMGLKNFIQDELIKRNKLIAVDQLEALHMICHKIGRIINGDPNYADSWIDIAGYAKLVADRLEGKVQ